jgi:hypothetical protein
LPVSNVLASAGMTSGARGGGGATSFTLASAPPPMAVTKSRAASPLLTFTGTVARGLGAPRGSANASETPAAAGAPAAGGGASPMAPAASRRWSPRALLLLLLRQPRLAQRAADARSAYAPAGRTHGSRKWAGESAVCIVPFSCAVVFPPPKNRGGRTKSRRRRLLRCVPWT